MALIKNRGNHRPIDTHERAQFKGQCPNRGASTTAAPRSTVALEYTLFKVWCAYFCASLVSRNPKDIKQPTYTLEPLYRFFTCTSLLISYANASFWRPIS